MEDEIKKIEQDAVAAIEAAHTASTLNNVRAKYLGRSDGALTLVLRKLGSLTLDERKKIGPVAQALKEKLEQLCDAQETQLLGLGGSVVDATLPSLAPETGHLHPVTLVRWQLEDLFTRMGFIIADGPEVESEWYNFDALNMPSWHPARDMQDTFYTEVQSSKFKVQSDEVAAQRLVLRTQTSPVQIRAMEKYGVPLRCIVPGRVYRNEATDARHENTFWQIEGLMIDRDISLAHLISISKIFLRDLLGERIGIRVRPGYFPFTEPSIEMDITCQLCADQRRSSSRFAGPKSQTRLPKPVTGNGNIHGDKDAQFMYGVFSKDGYGGQVNADLKCPVCKGMGWLEFMGAGLMHPFVLKSGGVDPKKYSGFAFGFGLTRLAMMKYGIGDIRMMMSGNLRFLEQF